MPAKERQEPDLLESVRLDLMLHGAIEVLGRLPRATNFTFVVRCCGEKRVAEPMNGAEQLAIYKPAAGERPLSDFPSATLYRREVAAYQLSQALGWGLVPPTVARQDGPLGPGSLQLFVDHDPAEHYFTLLPHQTDYFRRLAFFDLLCNNADRKSGHCLLDRSHRIWAVDHGLTFHAEPKLRTVIWDFAGEPIPAALRQASSSLARRLEPGQTGVRRALGPLLSKAEMVALRRRAEFLGQAQTFPQPESSFSFPWPLV